MTVSIALPTRPLPPVTRIIYTKEIKLYWIATSPEIQTKFSYSFFTHCHEIDLITVLGIDMAMET